MNQPQLTTATLESTDQPPQPDVPAAVVIAFVQAVIGLLVAFGLDVTDELQDAIVQLTTVALVVIPLADAWLRGKRNERLARERVASIQATQVVS